MEWADWHAVLEKLHRWQELSSGILGFSAGLLGFLAAIYAVRTTMRGEARQQQRELLSIRRALTAEIFQLSSLAFSAHKRIKAVAQRPTGVTIHELEDATRFPDAVIYPNNAGHIGLLGDHTNDIVWFFAQIDVLRAGVARIRRDLFEQHSAMERVTGALHGPQIAALKGIVPSGIAIGRENSDNVTEKLLIIAEGGAAVLPHLTSATIDDDPVFNFRRAVKQTRQEWGTNRFEDS